MRKRGPAGFSGNRSFSAEQRERIVSLSEGKRSAWTFLLAEKVERRGKRGSSTSRY